MKCESKQFHWIIYIHCKSEGQCSGIFKYDELGCKRYARSGTYGFIPRIGETIKFGQEKYQVTDIEYDIVIPPSHPSGLLDAVNITVKHL